MLGLEIGGNLNRNFALSPVPQFSSNLLKDNFLENVNSLFEPKSNDKHSSQSSNELTHNEPQNNQSAVVATKKPKLKSGIHVGIIVEFGAAM